MPKDNPKRIGRRMAAKYAALRKWKRCWAERPDQMERARQRNSAKAHEKAHELTQGLKDHVSSWPSSMTKAEFVGRLKADVKARLLGKGRTRKGYDWKSYRARLVRLGFCSFDKATKTWTNNTVPPVDFRREMCDTDAS